MVSAAGGPVVVGVLDDDFEVFDDFEVLDDFEEDFEDIVLCDSDNDRLRCYDTRRKEKRPALLITKHPSSDQGEERKLGSRGSSCK